MGLAETLPLLKRAILERDRDMTAHLLVVLLSDLFNEPYDSGPSFVDVHTRTILEALGHAEEPASPSPGDPTFNAVFHADTEQFLAFLRSDRTGLYVYERGGWFKLPNEDDSFDGTEWISLTKAGVALMVLLLVTGQVPERVDMLMHAEPN